MNILADVTARLNCGGHIARVEEELGTSTLQVDVASGDPANPATLDSGTFWIRLSDLVSAKEEEVNALKEAILSSRRRERLRAELWNALKEQPAA